MPRRPNNRPPKQPPKPRWTNPEGQPTVRWNQVRWRTTRPPLSDRDLQRRYHPSKPFTGALHPSVYPNRPNCSAFNRDSIVHQPTPVCSAYPHHLGYRRFHSSLPRDSSLRPVPPDSRSTPGVFGP